MAQVWCSEREISCYFNFCPKNIILDVQSKTSRIMGDVEWILCFVNIDWEMSVRTINEASP